MPTYRVLYCTYRRRRAACPQAATYVPYWARTPATGVPYAPRTVISQALEEKPMVTKMATAAFLAGTIAQPNP